MSEMPYVDADVHCCCPMHATVMGTVPDPGCPLHGNDGLNVWDSCDACGVSYRARTGHTCPEAAR